MARLRLLLRRGAELVGGLLLAAMFGAFLLQVFTRYVINRPLDWTLEVCLITYVWFVFWACAFLLEERDHIAFGLLYQSVRAPVRRVLALLSAGAIAGLFLAAAPATWDFIAFMARDRTWVLGLRFDLVFGIFLVFMLAAAARSLVRFARLLGGRWREQL
ncbi:MAG: TRAP transporter small permease [Geminicoccaceae bacterium]